MIVTLVSLVQPPHARFLDRTGGRLAGRTPAKLASLPLRLVSESTIWVIMCDRWGNSRSLISRALLVVTTAASTAAEKRGADRAKDALDPRGRCKPDSAPLDHRFPDPCVSRTTKQPAARNSLLAVHAIPLGPRARCRWPDPPPRALTRQHPALSSPCRAVKRALDPASPIVNNCRERRYHEPQMQTSAVEFRHSEVSGENLAGAGLIRRFRPVLQSFVGSRSSGPSAFAMST
jgi:hypothetical protein